MADMDLNVKVNNIDFSMIEDVTQLSDTSYRKDYSLRMLVSYQYTDLIGVKVQGVASDKTIVKSVTYKKDSSSNYIIDTITPEDLEDIFNADKINQNALDLATKFATNSVKQSQVYADVNSILNKVNTLPGVIKLGNDVD